MAKTAELTITKVEEDQGQAQDRWAMELASNIDADASPTLMHLANIRREYEGGPFVVMHNVLDRMDQDTVDRLPRPRTETGNNPAWYKLTKVVGKKVKVDKVYFYDRVAEQLPTVKALLDRKSKLERSLDKDANHEDIGKEIFDIAKVSREGEIGKIKDTIRTAKNNVGKAFELFFQLKSAYEYKGITIDVTYAYGPDGKLMDGKEGRPFKVDDIKAPIRLCTTDKGRQATDYDDFTVGSFLSLNFDKATEEGETWNSLISTLPKKGTGAPAETPTVGVNIRTVDKFVTIFNDVSEYLHRALESTDKAALDAIMKYAEKLDEEGDMFFYNLAYVHEFLEGQIRVADPRGEVRYQALVNKFSDKNVLADHVAKSKARHLQLITGGKK
jgi:hypothetical protein